MTVTVSGRPVARVVPLDRRPTTMPWSIMASALDRVAADRGLTNDLREALSDTTDDLE